MGVALFQRLVHQLGDHAHRRLRLVILVHQLRHLHERAGDTLRQHQEGEQGADENRIVGCQRQIDPERISAGDGKPFKGPNAGLDHGGDIAFACLELGDMRNLDVPGGALAIFQRQRLHGAHALQGLDQKAPRWPSAS